MKAIQPAGLVAGETLGVSHAVALEESGLIFVSGQLDWDGAGGLRSGDLYGQAAGALDNVETVLKAAGAGLGDIVRLRAYLRDDAGAGAAVLARLAHERFQAPFPAATLIGGVSLIDPGALVEIEATALRRAS